jgi:hypothetical protein
MNSEFCVQNAFDLGSAAANRSVDSGDSIMSFEKLRRQLTNEPEIIASKALLRTLVDERDDLRSLLRTIIPSVLKTRFRRLYFIIVAAILMLGGLAFTHLAFEPFGLGWQSWIYAVALSFVCAAPADVVLERYGNPRVVAIAASIGFITGVCGLLILAHLRGDVLALYLRTALSEASSNPGPIADAARFYESSVHRLQLLFSLLAVSLEIATGLMVWEARRISNAPLSLVADTKKRLAEIEPDMVRLLARIVYLENDPAIFEAQFLRDFHRGLKFGVERSALRRMSGLGIAIIVAFGLARGQSVTVVVPDFTQSTTIARSADGESEYYKNLEATAKLLSLLPSATRFSVIGITETTYSNPLVLLSGEIPSDGGPLTFMNRTQFARNRYAQEFKTAANRVKVTAKTSDVIGGFFIASEILQNGSPGKRNLVFIGDMRQSAKPLDIETPKVISVRDALSIVEHHHLLPDLHGVDVWIIGVDAAGKDVAYISSLREFWTAFLAKSGAHLRAFSMMRDLPDLSHPRSKGDHP